MTFVDADSTWRVLVAGLAVLGVGVGMANPTLASAALAAVPRERSGMASGAVNTARQFGFAVGHRGARHACSPPAPPRRCATRGARPVGARRRRCRPGRRRRSWPRRTRGRGRALADALGAGLRRRAARRVPRLRAGRHRRRAAGAVAGARRRADGGRRARRPQDSGAGTCSALIRPAADCRPWPPSPCPTTGSAPSSSRRTPTTSSTASRPPSPRGRRPARRCTTCWRPAARPGWPACRRRRPARCARRRSGGRPPSSA